MRKQLLPVILEVMGAVGIVMLVLFLVSLDQQYHIPMDWRVGIVGFLLLLVSGLLKERR